MMSAAALLRHITRRQRGVLAPKEILQVFHDYFLVLGVRRIQAELVQHHFAVLGPHPPSFLGDVVVDLLPQFGVEWRLIEPWHLFLELHAKHNMARGHWITRHTSSSQDRF